MIEKKLLQEYRQFILSKQSQNMREGFYKNIVIRTHFRHANTENKLEYGQLIKHIKKDYKFSQMPSLHIDRSITSLLAENKIKQIGNTIISHESTRNKIQKDMDSFEKLEKNIDNELHLLLKTTIPDITLDQIKSVIDNFHKFINEILKTNGSKAIKIFLEKEPTINIGTNGGFEPIYHANIRNALDKKYHKSIDDMFNEYLQNPSNDLSRYFFACTQGYVLYEILNLDPQFQKLEKLSWTKKKIYIDTNVLIDLIFSNALNHNSLKILIEQTKKLGAQLIISEKTLDEFTHVFENFKKKIPQIHFKPQFSLIYEESNNDNPILSTYLHEVKINKKYDSDVFIKTYENFGDILEYKYSIKIERLFKINENIDSESLKTNIRFRGPNKSPNVVNHDYYNILRVRQIRENIDPDEIGPGSWLLTTDRGLIKAERDTYKKNAQTSCVHIVTWLQIISPFISPELLKDAGYAFAQLLSGNFSSSKITISNVSTLLNLFIDDTKFSVKQIKKIIGDEFIKNKLNLIHETMDPTNEINSQHIKSIVNHSMEIIKKDIGEEHKKLNDKNIEKITFLENNVKELKDMVSHLKDEKKTVVDKNSHIIKNIKITAISIIFLFIIDTVLYYIFTEYFDINLYNTVSLMIPIILAEVFILIKILFYKK